MRKYDFSRTLFQVGVKGYIANMDTMSIEEKLGTTLTTKSPDKMNEKELEKMFNNVIGNGAMKCTIISSKEVIANWDISDIIGLAHIDEKRV